jgi:hypothetical protein
MVVLPLDSLPCAVGEAVTAWRGHGLTGQWEWKQVVQPSDDVDLGT